MVSSRSPKLSGKGENYKARNEELKFKQLANSLVPTDAVERVWKDSFLTFRAVMLGLPRKCASMVRDAPNDGKAEEILREVVYQALEELAGTGVPTSKHEPSPRHETPK